MRNAIDKFYQDSFCLLSLTLSLIFLIFGVIFLFFSWAKIPPQVPILLSRPWGEEQLAPKQGISLLPLVSFFLLTFNFFFAVRFSVKEPLLSRILAGASMVLILILILALFQIVTLIT